MIVVTRLNGSRFAVNPDLIERIQENPDTTLVMLGGATYVVREDLAAVIRLIAEYRALVLATVRELTGRERPRSVLRVAADNVDSGPVAATPLRPTER